MKGIVQKKYGDYKVLTIEEVEKPKPGKGEVLVKVQGVSLNAPDWRLLEGKPFIIRFSSGLMKPKHPVKGGDFSGTVVKTGEGVSNLKVGDEVFGDLADSGFGAFSEFVSAKASILSQKPRNLSFLESAALPLAAVTALQGIRDAGRLKAGEKVLILGASGGVGTCAVQLSKYFGGEVTAVTSKKNESQALSLGATEVLDYKTMEFEKLIGSYDLILAINGYYPVKLVKDLLKPQGRFVLIGSSSTKELLKMSIFGSLLSQKEGKSYQVLMAKPSGKDLAFIAKLAEEGAITPILAKEIPFEKIPEGIKELSEGHVSGKIVSKP